MDLAYRKYKRRKMGRCNLCGELRRLSWDHIPPQGGIELQPVEIDRAVATFGCGLQSTRPEVSADGLKFRTICSACNALLGARYDPVLNDFAKTLGRFLSTVLTLPRVVHVPTRPTALARAVLTHLLAARLTEKDAFFDPLIRPLATDEESPLPTGISVFYWVHPYAQQIVMRDCLMPLRRGDLRSGVQRFGLLKYFPVAFMVTDAASYEGLESLTIWRNEPSSSQLSIPVDLTAHRDPYWPEAPAPGNFLFGGEEMMQSVKAHPAPHLFNQP